MPCELLSHVSSAFSCTGLSMFPSMTALGLDGTPERQPSNTQLHASWLDQRRLTLATEAVWKTTSHRASELSPRYTCSWDTRACAQMSAGRYERLLHPGPALQGGRR